MRWLVEPGFWSSGPVHTALVVGGVVSIVSAVVGVFTVARGQSFGGHALTDVATAGGSLAFLVNISPVLGFVAFGLAGGGAMEAIGVRRLRGRDLATGIVLGAADGVAALLLYFDTTSSATTGATQQVLFGSIFAISTSTVPLIIVLGAASLAIVAVAYRPLLLSSLSDDLAVARGVSPALVGAAFMVALALAVALSSVATGTILSTALLIGPPAAALRLVRRTGAALAAASALGVASTWIGILLAYDSSSWFADHRGLPVSFFIVMVTLVVYLASGMVARSVRHRPARPVAVAPGPVLTGVGG